MFDLGRGFIASAARMPNTLAISDGEQSWTYAEWREDIKTLAHGLVQAGLQPGDHIVTLLSNRAEAATLHLACQLAAIVITPLNWRATQEELDYVIRDAEARALVFEPLTEPTAAACVPRHDILSIGIEGCSADLDFATLQKATVASSLPLPDPQRLSVMLYTSGTTGRGKGVPRTHASERSAALAHVAQNQYGRGEVTLGVMPLYHTMGVRSLLASILVNGHFVCQRRFDAAAALILIARHQITNLYLVPTLYHDLVNHPDFAATPTHSVTKLGFAGQSMTDGLLRQLAGAFEPELFVNHYGSSEIYTFTIEPDAPSKPGSAGKAGLNQEVRVVGLGSGEPDAIVANKVEGEIIASLDGDESFSGYWNRPDANAKSLRAGWYFTGDIGYTDGDGDLFVTGRVDDMIISGGENILPVEIESVLSLHPGVSEVAVVGLADPRWGQTVTAFVVRRAGMATQDLDSAVLDAWCLRSELVAFKRPRRYEFIQNIPKSPVGKVLRRKLIEGQYELEIGDS
jgi:2-furoate---CoA ligase